MAKDLGLRGDRFAPLTYETMTPEQRAMTDAVLAGKRGSMQGPYNVMLRSPENEHGVLHASGDGLNVDRYPSATES